MARRRSWLWIPLFLFFVLAAAWLAIGLMNRALGGGSVSLASRNVMVVDLVGPIAERPDLLWGSRPVGALTVREIDTALRRAASDSRVVGVRLNVGPLTTGFAKAQAIRDAVAAFRDSGKPVVARMELGSLLDVYVAGSAETVVQVPTGTLFLGLASRSQYYRELLDTLGVEFEVFHTGPYKTAMNPFTETDMAPEEREVIDSLLGDLYGQIVQGLAADRGLDEDSVRAIIDRGLVSAAEGAAAGLIDEAAFDDRVEELLSGEGAEPRRISLRDYLTASDDSWGSLGRPVVALVHVDGMIVPGNPGDSLFGGGFAGGDTIARALRTAREAPEVRAVVLRVDSPGGAVSASDVIWREVELTARAKPVIVSMSDVAASGGYWIATAATRVLAEPGTYTGSIGVVSSRINLEGAYAKLGIGNAVVKRGRNADLFIDSRPLSEEQRALLQASNEETYRLFIGKVAAAREMSPERVEELAAGRVWTGRQALEVGLIDALGGLQAALREARQYAAIGPDQPITLRVYPETPGLFDFAFDLFGSARAGDLAALAGREQRVLPTEARRALAAVELLRAGGVHWAIATSPLPNAVR